MNPQLQKLITLLTYSDDGAFAIALYDRVAMRQEMLKTLKEQLKQRVYEVTLSGSKRNPIDLIRNLKPQTSEVVCLYDIERGFPDALGYLDLQREVLADLNISLVVWVNHYEYRELATKAPNFYSFRTSTFDFTNPAEIPVTEPLFVGREPDMEALRGLVDKGGCVALTGYGGVGKSTLALQLSRRMRSRFEETVWVNCETRPLLGDILLQVAVVLMGEGMRQVGPDAQRKRLAKALCERPCLIVLDNFESVGEDKDLLHWLKTVSAPSAVLLTSRQQIPELDAPYYALPELPPGEAVEMFTLRARLAGWQGGEADVVPRLCELVGNLPLAIELLAARADELPLSQLLEEVGKSLNALVSGDDPLRAERHQSIAACFRVSFDRLSETAKELLKRLSILPDGASEQIIADFTKIQDWQQPIEECIAHSMLNFDGKRYRLHPLIGRFVLTQLGVSFKKWLPELVSYFYNLALPVDDVLCNSWHSLLDKEWHNVVAVIEVAEYLQDYEAVIGLTSRLERFLIIRGFWSEAERLILSRIVAARLSFIQGAEIISLISLGNLFSRQGRLMEAEKVCKQGLVLAREQNKPIYVSTALENLSAIYVQQHRWSEAEKTIHEGLKIAKEHDYVFGQASFLGELGSLHFNRQNFSASETAYRQSLSLFQKIEDYANCTVALGKLGSLYEHQKQWNKAEACLSQSLDIARRIGSYVDAGTALKHLAQVNKANGNTSRAVRFANEALQAYGMTEDYKQQEEIRKLLAEIGNKSTKQLKRSA